MSKSKQSSHKQSSHKQSSIADKLESDCCASLLGTKEKADIIQSMRNLEAQYELAVASKKILLEELRAVRSQMHSIDERAVLLAKRVFVATYKGKSFDMNKGWQQLCVELGLPRSSLRGN